MGLVGNLIQPKKTLIIRNLNMKMKNMFFILMLGIIAPCAVAGSKWMKLAQPFVKTSLSIATCGIAYGVSSSMPYYLTSKGYIKAPAASTEWRRLVIPRAR